jgi:antitoxin component of MazEF toxin-antitoxin module
MTFKDFWIKKTHDIPIQNELDEVKDDVHELDERVDQYEDAKGHLKPGVHVDKVEVTATKPYAFPKPDVKKNTVHITYDQQGVPVSSYVDDDMDKGMFPPFQVSKPGPSIHTAKWDKCIEDVKRRGGANAYAVCTAQLGEEAFKSEVRHMGYVKSLIAKARKEIKKMGIGDAGGIPHSLLARQDLEGDAQLEKDEESDYQLVNHPAENGDETEEKAEMGDKIKQDQEERQQQEIDQRKKKMSKASLTKNHD